MSQNSPPKNPKFKDQHIKNKRFWMHIKNEVSRHIWSNETSSLPAKEKYLQRKNSRHVRRLHGSLTTQYPEVIIGRNCCDALRALAADVLQ